MKTIELTQGQVALVSNEDFEWLNQYRWRACFSKGAKSYYAARNEPRQEGQPRKTIFMSRLIMGVTDPKMFVDHINHNTLDNQRSNLRKCTCAQNGMNQRPQEGKISQYKGVCWYKDRNKWHAQIKKEGKLIHLGFFDSEIKTAEAYDDAAWELFGEYAYLNFSNRDATIASL